MGGVALRRPAPARGRRFRCAALSPPRRSTRSTRGEPPPNRPTRVVAATDDSLGRSELDVRVGAVTSPSGGAKRDRRQRGQAGENYHDRVRIRVDTAAPSGPAVSGRDDPPRTSQKPRTGVVAGGLILLMRFAVLGPLEVSVDRGPLPLGGRKQRLLLAALLLARGAVVLRDKLIDALWGEDAPPSAAESLDTYVYRLRKVLGHERLLREAGGYRLRVEPGELDADRFEQLVASASDAADGGDHAAAVAELPEALSCGGDQSRPRYSTVRRVFLRRSGWMRCG